MRQHLGMTTQTLQRATLTAFLLLAGAWYWYARSHAPAVSSVNGVYANACCKNLVLQNGVIVAGKDRVPFKLENMKFGLTAYPSKRVEVHGTEIVAVANADDAGVPFGKAGKTLTLCANPRCDREYLFRRR